MITRQEALALIAILDESPVIAPKVKDMLNEMSYCIEAETIGLHLWDAPEDLLTMDNLVNEAIETEDASKIERYVFGVSDYEERKLQEDDGIDSGEPVEPSVQTMSENKPKEN